MSRKTCKDCGGRQDIVNHVRCYVGKPGPRVHAQTGKPIKKHRESLMASFDEGTQGPNEAPRVDKRQVFQDIKAVLERHYMSALMRPNNAEAYTAWKIMQDVRTHLELSVQETG